MEMLRGTRKVRLVGGPMDGWVGDYVDNGQDRAVFAMGGPDPVFLYVKQDDAKVSTWRYDTAASNALIRQAALAADVRDRGVVGVGE